jgi:subtilisin family serine protease
MAENIPNIDFFLSPNTVDFIARRSEYFESFLAENPEVIATKTLAGRYVIAYVDRANFQTIVDVLSTSFVSAVPIILGLLDRASLEASGIIQVQQQPYLDLRGQGVLFGIVDTGIDYTQDVFIYEDGTSKIQYIFDQSGTENAPEGGYTVGTEYTNEQINEALRSENPYDIVPQRDESGHGTFLASVAVGRDIDEFSSAAPDAELIVVKLKKARPFYLEFFTVPPEQENAFESSSVMVGIEYILEKALELGRPVVICLGVGSNFGSHDGFSVFEEYLSGVSNLRGVCLCTAVGNESQAKHHTQGRLLSRGATNDIDVRAGTEGADIRVAIWNNVSDRIAVSVRSPTGELVSRLPARTGTTTRVRLVLENSIVIVDYYFPVEGSGDQVTVVKILNSTPGIWTITVHGDIVLDGTYHAWLPLTGFISPAVEFLEPSPYYTMVVPSTMIGSIACGAYNSSNNSLYVRSSWGPTRIGAIRPDLVAPGVEVGGYYPSGYGTMDGTSASTAIVAGACVLMMQWGIVQGNDVSLSTYQIRAYLIRGCNRSENMIYPNNQWGYGILDLMNTFNLMREI